MRQFFSPETALVIVINMHALLPDQSDNDQGAVLWRSGEGHGPQADAWPNGPQRNVYVKRLLTMNVLHQPMILRI